MSEERKQERLSWREAAVYTWRGIKILWQAVPEVFASAIAVNVLRSLCAYVPLYFTAQLVNEIAGGRDPHRIWMLLLALLAVTAGINLLLRGAVRWETVTRDNKLDAAFNRTLFEKLLSMDFCDIDDPSTGDLLTRVHQNNQWSGWGLCKIYFITVYLFYYLFRILGAVALAAGLFLMRVPEGSSLAWLNRPVCSLGVLVLLILTVLLSPALYNRGNRYWSSYDGTQGNREFGFFYFAAYSERSRAADIRIYEQDAFLRQHIKQEGKTCDFGPRSSIGVAALGPMGLYIAASEAVSRAFTGVIYLFVGLKALGGAFGIGLVTQYVGALAGMADGVSGLLKELGNLRENAEFLRPTFQLLDIPNSMYQGSLTTEKRSDRNYEIEFRDVSFQYPGTDVWALRHVNMKFQVGGRLAVVGENGSGKTTFIKLLCRLYDPTEGTILLNGIDIRKYRYDDYLALFSAVFQDFKLLAQPLGQNVAATENYDRARVQDCLEKVGFGPRLQELPKGLDTCLYRSFEDDGVEISGGEAQKIALARVLYQDAPFIVLDEPTAALDPEAEAEVYSKFDEIVTDKTAIYISHRLSSCRFCDEIAVFEGGRVVQQGTHDSLLAQEGKYCSLWTAQAQYYKKKAGETEELF